MSLSSAALGHGAPTRAGFLQRELFLGRQAYRYVVYVPLAAAALKPPIVLYLHGAGGIGKRGGALESGLAETIRRDANRFPAIAVFPEASERWVTPRMERLALASLDRSASEFAADPSREYLMGYSVGAAGAWRLAYLHPRRFAALVAIAGSVHSSKALFEPNEYAADIKTHAYLASRNPCAALAARLRGMPITIYHGSADTVVPPTESRCIARALRRISATVRFTEFPLVGHRGVLPKALSDPHLFTWIFAQRKSSVMAARQRTTL